MAIVKWVLIAALASLPAAPQEKTEEARKPRQEPVKRIIPVKYADVKSLGNTLAIFGCGIMPSADLKVLAVSCPPDVVAVIEEAVKRLDVPAPAAKNVELTAYFLVGAEKETPAGNPVPAELEPLVKQVRSAFAYKNFRLLDTVMLRTRAGQPANVNGVFSGASPGVWMLSIKSVAPSAGEGGATVRIDGLRAAIQFPLPPTAKGDVLYRDAIINADIDIREGQKVVVGKSSMEGPEKALIVVLSAKVL